MARHDDAPRGRRDLILAAAAEVLLTAGLKAATTRMVTDRAGVGTGLLNHYFRWPELRALAWSAIFDAVAGDINDGSRPPAVAMERYLATAFAPDAWIYWRLWIEATDLAGTDAALADALSTARQRMQDSLAAILRDGDAAGCWRADDPDATALRLGALYDGLAGLLLSGARGLDTAAAEAHLRTAFRLECGGGG